MEPLALFQTLGISLGLGLLVGLQRERGTDPMAGIRTFPLITVLGTVSALLAETYGGWILGAGVLAIAGFSAVSAFVGLKRGADVEPGITTQIAALVMFAIGAMLVVLPQQVPVALTAAVAMLLHAKHALHTFAERLGDKDVRAIMQFALISLVVLPILPDQTYGPYETLNPYVIWLMVVLVVGISLLGYLAYKFLGQSAGVLLGGILGGLVSSTATTVSFSRRGKTDARQVRASTVVILVAAVVVFARVLVEISVVSRGLLGPAAGPMLTLAGVGAVISAILWLGIRRQPSEMPEQQNPSEMKTALVFGALYALVRLAAAWGEQRFGTSGLYVVAGISGLADMDAITLSTARMHSEKTIEAALAWRVIMVGILSNLVFKALIVSALGGRRLAARVWLLFAPSLAVGVLLILFWPDAV